MFKDEDGEEIVNECIYGEPFQIIKKSKEYSRQNYLMITMKDG